MAGKTEAVTLFPPAKQKATQRYCLFSVVQNNNKKNKNNTNNNNSNNYNKNNKNNKIPAVGRQAIGQKDGKGGVGVCGSGLP